MKFLLKHYQAVIIALLITVIVCYTAIAQSEYTPSAHENYLSKVEVETNLYNSYLDAKAERIHAEGLLAEAKILDYANGLRPLAEDEDISVLKEKAETVKPMSPLLLTDEEIVEQEERIEEGTTSDVNISCLALAVATAETQDCTTGMGVTKNNCHGLMEWPAWNNYQRTGRTFANKDESYAAFRELWERSYGGYPTWPQAIAYTGNDNPATWYSNMETTYAKCVNEK